MYCTINNYSNDINILLPLHIFIKSVYHGQTDLFSVALITCVHYSSMYLCASNLFKQTWAK